MAITDLTNTKWIGNDTLSISEMKIFKINFINNIDYTHFQIYPFDDDIFLYDTVQYMNSDENTTLEAYRRSWEDTSYKTIIITGGEDATNSELISWLEANGTLEPLEVEMTPKEQFISQLNELSDAINEKAKTSGKMTISQMIENVKGISDGGLVGYSGGTISSSATFKFGLLEDGSITTTWNSSNKYVCLVIYHYASTGTYIYSSANITSKSNSSYFFIVPNANNWKAQTMANDSGGV